MDTPDVPPHDPRLETRVSRLEEGMGDLKAMLARIDATLPHLATAAQIADLRGEVSELRKDVNAQIVELRGDMGEQIAKLRGDLDTRITELRGEVHEQAAALRGEMREQSAALGADLGTQIAELRGRVNHLPTAWQMTTAIVAGQVSLAALLAAIVFGVLKMAGPG
jgi:hypothetical protein